MINKDFHVLRICMELRNAAQYAIINTAKTKNHNMEWICDANAIVSRYINDVASKLGAGETFTDFNPDMELIWHISIVDNNLRIVVRTFEDDGTITNVRDWARYMSTLCYMLIGD